jgi:uncharacterized membrane protein YphA (DoxX/SURF4 family)
MTRFEYRYPDGAAGIALLLLRVGQAAAAPVVAAALTPLAGAAALAHALAWLAGLLLVLGLATRLVAVALGGAVVAILLLPSGLDPLLLAGETAGCAAIALMGAGAWSLDARRHGRRVIRLQSRTPDRGDGG